MATRADFDAALADLASAIAAAATRFGSGGPVITDQDIATLKQDTANVNLLGTGGGGGSVTFAIAPVFISASAQATCTLKVATAPTSDQAWNVTSSPPDALSVPSTVTWPAGQPSVDFKVTAGAPTVDTPCTITATFGSLTASVTATVAHS